MKVYKRISLLLIVMLLLLSSCSIKKQEITDDTPTQVENDLYEVRKENGEYFLIIKKSLADTQVSGMTFSDPMEMKLTILSGGLTDKQLSALWTPPDENGESRVALFDLDNLYEPVVPKDTKIIKLSFHGDEYRYSLTHEHNDWSYSYVTFYRKADFEKKLSDRLNSTETYQTVVENGIEKKIYEYEYEYDPSVSSLFYSSGKIVYYRIQKIGTIFHVFENYVYDYSSISSLAPSAAHPNSVTIYLENGSYSVFTFGYVGKALPLEWILELDTRRVQ